MRRGILYPGRGSGLNYRSTNRLIADSASFLGRRRRPSQPFQGSEGGLPGGRGAGGGQEATQPAGKSPGTAGSLRIRLLLDAEAQVFQGTAPGNPAADSLPLLLVRLRGKDLFIRAVLEPVPEGAEPSVSALEPIPGGLRISTRRGERRAALS